MKPVTNSMDGHVWLLLLSLSLLWGGSFLFVELALRDYLPLTIVTLRVAIGALVLHCVLRIKKLHFPMDLKSIGQFAVMGTLNNAIPFSLIVWGQQSIDAGRASVLNATMPLFTVLFAHWLLTDEKLSASKITGVLIGFAGVFVLAGPAAISGNSVNSLIGQLAVLGAAISYAFAGIFGKQLNRFDPQVSATGMLTASAVLMLPFTLVFEPLPSSMPSLLSTVSVVALGVACTALAYLFYFKILTKAGSSNLSLVTFLIPPSAIIMGVVFLNERLSFEDCAGVALILVGMAIATGIYKRFV